ncbi:MAG: oligosaccharide flippase family protein, partial [Bacilli bacterium]|nr:oligosaccharide flippase family protein [Bacilli bacterium]
MKTSIRSSVVVNLIRTITMTVLSLVTFPLVCRLLGDSALGTFSWASSFIYYFIVLSKISIPNVAVRECAKVKDDPVKLSMKVQEFFILQAIMTVLSFGLMCLLVFTVPSFKDNQSIIFILSINFLISVFAFEWVFTALEKHTYLAVRSIIILAIADILIFALIKRPDDLYLYAFLTTVVTILTVITNLIYLPSILKFKKVGKYNFKQYVPILGVLFIISILVAIYSKTDSFILGFIDSSKASVGSYSVGMKGV